MIKDVLTIPDKRLTLVSKKVKRLKNVDSLIKDMQETMKHYEGVGLAAPQIGTLLRVVLINDIPFINPEIVYRSDEKTLMVERCLSIPGFEVEVERHKLVLVKSSNHPRMKLEELAARIMQHEIDHLDGKLITRFTRRENR